MHVKSFLVAFLVSGILFCQYPSDSRLLADVKSQNPTEFAEIKFLGNWFMAHDRVPDWQAPDAAQRELSIKGKVNAAGEWWEYFGLAIYHKAGNQFAFNRVFINEDPKLRGVKLPADSYFKDLFMKELRTKNSMLMSMNYVLANATNFYSFEIGEKPWVTGNHTERFVYYTIDVTLDAVNGYNLEKRKVPIEVKLNKSGDSFTFSYAMPKNDGALLSSIQYPNSDIVDNLTRFGYDGATLEGMTNSAPSYPKAPGDNGSYPNDDAIISYITKWATASEENFSTLFGPRSKSMFISFEFSSNPDAQLQSSGNTFSKVFNVYYEFINEKTAEMEFYVYGGYRPIQLEFLFENNEMQIRSFEYKGETSYTKKDNIAWSYRNNYTERTFDKTIFK